MSRASRLKRAAKKTKKTQTQPKWWSKRSNGLAPDAPNSSVVRDD